MIRACVLVDATSLGSVASLRREVDRLFEDFGRGFGVSLLQRPMHDIVPLWRREWAWPAGPAVDFVETETSYEVTAELPGRMRRTSRSSSPMVG